MATKVPPLALDSTKDFSSLVPSAFEAANAAYAQANSTVILVSAAFDKANTAANSASGVESYANAAFIQANAAFLQANTGGASTDQVARDIANAAFLQANTDFISLSMPGTITSPVTGTARYYPTDTIVINTVYANLGTSPTGNFTFIIKKNGTSIGNTFILSSAVMTPNAVNVSLTTSDYLTLDVTGVNGSDLSVKLKYSY